MAATLISCFASRLGRVALPERLGLDAVAAGRHVAPRARAVLGPVVERVLTRVLAAHLEPGPGSVGHRLEHRPEDVPERAVQAALVAAQIALPAGVEAHIQGGVGGIAIEEL